jgi:RNA polymerase sigma-70 factor (ECF subfamily)
LNEERCISQLKSGDPAAYRELVDHFRDRVYNTALALVRNAEDAQDVSQEVFIGVFQSAGSFRGDARLSTWVYRITVQKSLEHIRNARRKKRGGVLMSLLGREHLLPVETNAPFYHPGVKLENKERAAILFQAISQLNENQQTAFTLHKVEALSYAEIAEIMKISVSSVESLMFRAKQNLRKILGEYYEKNER